MSDDATKKLSVEIELKKTGVGSDSIHPTAAQYFVFARNISTNMSNWFPNVWIQTNGGGGGTPAINYQVNASGASASGAFKMQ